MTELPSLAPAGNDGVAPPADESHSVAPGATGARAFDSTGYDAPWADALAELVADSGEQLEVRFRHALEPWQMELVVGTLGAHVVVDRAAPRCVAPCEKCNAIEREDSMDTAIATCKIDGCENPAEATHGRYAKLCLRHRSEAVESGGGSARSNGSGMAESVKELLPLARKLDRAEARLAAVPEQDEAKVTVDEAIRRYQGVPSAENLAALNEATKEAAKGQPRREKIEGERDEADREFKAALTKLARRAAG